MADAAEKMRLFNGALRSIPKFHGGATERWHNHELQFKLWTQINGIEQIATARQQKMCVLHSLAGNATRAIELHQPAIDSEVTPADFLARIREVFLPRAESNLSRMDFELYRQGADESISEYATTKLALYHSSEPNPAVRSYAYLRSEMLRGIYSPYVKGEVIRMNPTDEASLLEAMITALGQAREAYELGVGVVANLDGLASTTRMLTGSMEKPGHHGGAEPMDIGRINEGDTTRARGGATEPKRCFKCQRLGHFSRECRVDTRTGARPKAPGKLTCYYCSKEGHRQADCYKKKKDQSLKGRPGKRPGVKKTADSGEDEDEETQQDWDHEEENIAKIDGMRKRGPKRDFRTQMVAKPGGGDHL